MLYPINTRVVLHDIRPGATLDHLPDRPLHEVAGRGFTWVWMLGVWQTGPAGRAVSRERSDWLAGYRRILPDLTDADVSGSPFAVRAYTANTDFGDPAALARLRQRLRQRNVK